MAQERRVARNLELQDDPGASAPYMQLQDTGQGAGDQWQLRDDADVSNWQPIEYERPTPPRTNWILPSLVGVMLLAVLSYVGWVGFSRFGANGTTVPALATATTAVDAGVTDGDNGQTDQAGQDNQDSPSAAVLQETPTVPPEPTLPLAATATTTPLPEPTVVLVDQRIATITNQYGVNARLEPNTTSEVLRVLEQGETAIVVDELTDAEGIDWLQVQISEGALVWISADFAEITTQQVAAEPSTEPVATTSPAPSTEAPAADVSVTVSSTFGLNARALPNADAEIITLLENEQTLSAVARSADNTWVQVQLENGDLAWVFVDLVRIVGDLNSLPVSNGEAATSTATTGVVTGTETISGTVPPATGVVTGTTPVTSTTGLQTAAGAPQGVTIVISSTLGVNARSTTSTDAEVLTVLEPGTELEAIAQNADGTWVQVPLEDGRLGWVFAAAVLTGPDVATLPQATPPAVGAEAERLPGVQAGTGVTSTGAISSTATVSPTIRIEPTAPLTATEAISETTAVTTPVDTTPVPEGATATVTGLIGTSVRPAPNTSQPAIRTLASGTVLPLAGRSADNQWVQVVLDDGALAWAFAKNVALNVGIEELPVKGP